MAFFRRSPEKRLERALAKAAGDSVNMGPGELQAYAHRLSTTVGQGVFPPVPDAVRESMVEQGMDSSKPFSPSSPLQTYFGDPSATRQFNFQTGANLITRPRQEYGRTRVSFDTLKAIYEAYDFAEMCIKHRISDVTVLDWNIIAADGVEGDVDSQIATAKKAIEKPDGTTPYAHWLAMFLRDTFCYDAGALQRGRLLNGKVGALEIIDGTTLAPMLDYSGRRPKAPASAYTQFVNGLPWAPLTDADIIYQPMWPTSRSPYGTPPMESLLLNANTDIRFQYYFLQYFTEGTMPDGFMTAPEDQTSPDAIKEFQQAWEAWLEGDQGQKHKLRWIPFGSKFQAAKDATFNDAFPLFLMHKTAAAHMVVVNDMGFTDDVNRSTGDNQVDVQFRIGTLPAILHVESILNSYLHEDLGLPQIRFQIETGQEKEDKLTEAQTWAVWIQNGVVSPDEPREQVLGMAVDKLHPIPRFIFSARAGAIPVKSIEEIGGTIDPHTAAPIAGTVVAADDVTPGEYVAPTGVVSQPDDLRAKRKADAAAAQQPPADPAVDGSGAAQGTTTAATGAGDSNPVQKELTSGVTSATGVTGSDLYHGDDDDDDDELDDEDVEKTLRQWKANSRSRLKKGLKPRRFADLPLDVADAVWSRLEAARSFSEVDAAFDLAKEAGTSPKAPPGAGPGQGSETATSTALVPAVGLAGGVLGTDIVAHYSGQLQQALSRLHPNAAALAAHVASQNSNPVDVAAALEQLRQAVRPAASTGLEQILDDVYSDSYLVGAHDAAAKLRAAGAPLPAHPKREASISQLVGEIDWSSWRPGNPEAARQVADGGLQDMLASADARIVGMTATQYQQIADALEAGLLAGDNTRTIARAVQGVVNSESRATMIARTEMARASEQASFNTYDLAGIRRWHWLDSADACPACQAMAAGGPYDMTEPSAPLHPNCRCSSAPLPDVT